jgi:WD40 repeat protein/serine/threonine protein kinase
MTDAMAIDQPKVEALFDAARIRPADQRSAYLDVACAGDAELRATVDSLLQAHDAAGDFLHPTTAAADLDPPILLLPPGTVIGRYKLLEPIGEGGYGVVFMAEQTSPVQRKVALKIIKAGMDTRQVIARFEAERQALALMDHQNIAKVFDAGMTDAGRPYFVMELVKGMPITRYCDEHHIEPRQRLELFMQVCQAVQHAHQKGIIHRDLKPSNVLVAQYDGKPVPKVIDFGVAKATGQSLTNLTMFTGFGDVIGTLEYMSPEQAEANQLDVDTRSDIYSLGVLLYELLTGSTPLEHKRVMKAGLLEMLRVVREEEPQRPSMRLNTSEQLPSISANRGLEPKKLNVLVHGELDWIVMKALEKDRARRYETANGLAADVQRYLDDEAVQACPPTALYRFRKFARRNKRALSSAAVLAVAALIGIAALASSTILVSRANKELSASVIRERRAADRERREAYFQRITVAHRELSMDNPAAALRALHDCPQDLREWEWHYLMRLCRVDPLVIRDTTEVNGMAFSPNGERLASGGGDGSIKIWNSRTRGLIQSFSAHTDWVVSVAFHPDGKHLASRGVDRKVKVWDLTATGQAEWTEPCDVVRKFGTAYTVAFSLDGRQLAAATDGAVKVWDWKNGQLLQSLPGGNNIHPIPVAFSRDGRLATGTFRQDLKLWDPGTGILLRTVDAHRGQPVSALAFSPDGELLASASFDRTAKLSNSRTGEVLHSFDLHTGNVECVAFGAGGRRLASGGEDKTVRVWDTTTGREVLGLRGHTDRCACVAFSPDGRRLASASSDRTIRIWDATPLRGDEGEETRTFTQHSHEIRSVAFGPDGQRIASAGSDGLVKVWDAQTGEVSAEFSRHKDSSGRSVVVFCVAWQPKGHLIASAGQDTLRVWDARTGREAFRLAAEQAKAAVAFSPDGRYLVTGNVNNGAVQVWDAGTGQEVGTLDTHSREVFGVVFSRDGEHLALASRDGIVKLWDDAKRLDKKRLDEKKDARLPIRTRVAGPSLNVAFSPDGRWLATGGEESTVKIWDVQSGAELRTLRGHKGDIYAVAISPDGRWVASGGEDSTVKVWDTHNEYRLAHTFRGHTSIVSSVAFSPDGRRLVSGSRDATVKVWDLTQLIGPEARKAGGP